MCEVGGNSPGRPRYGDLRSGHFRGFLPVAGALAQPFGQGNDVASKSLFVSTKAAYLLG